MMKKINIKNLIISLLITLGIGALSGFLTQNSRQVYMSLKMPSFAPPGWLFPVIWTILYILMAVSAYIIYESDAATNDKERALSIYAFQLFLNFLWPIVFFGFEKYLAAFFIVLILWILVLFMIYYFWEINKIAAVLQVPYLLWLTFAAYLNLSIYFLNRV